ncbi:MAG: glycerophosphodiester phosphodiesterase [Clostridiales bacterium]|nr:glycerophosphodiester phosphodiesterase [Clostridiales bacterium]
MKEKSRLKKFKRFLKRNLTPTWAKHFAYQVFALVVSVFMVVGVATYAIDKSYDERELSFTESFTITAHTGAFDTEENTIASVEAAINNNVKVFEIDIRRRPDSTLVMSHDLVVTNYDGVELAEVFEMLRDTDIVLNLDIKETRTLDALYDLLCEYALSERVFLTGIETVNIKALGESKCSGLPFYLNYQPSRTKIFSDEYKEKLLDLLKETGAVGINCNYKYASSTLSQLLHDNGYKLSVWTVNNKYAMKRMLVLQPDNITTKEYDRLVNIIETWGE